MNTVRNLSRICLKFSAIITLLLVKDTSSKSLIMKHLIIFSATLFFVNCAIAQQTFDPSGNDAIYIDIKNNDFSVQKVKETKFTIDLEIQVNYPKEVIDELVGIGRYKIESTGLRCWHLRFLQIMHLNRK